MWGPQPLNGQRQQPHDHLQTSCTNKRLTMHQQIQILAATSHVLCRMHQRAIPAPPPHAHITINAATPGGSTLRDRKQEPPTFSSLSSSVNARRVSTLSSSSRSACSDACAMVVARWVQPEQARLNVRSAR